MDIFLNLIDFFTPRNFKVLKTDTFEDGTLRTEYFFGGRRYLHIGEYPPTFKTRKFPIVNATCVESGTDVTDDIKKCIGPLNSHEPDLGYVFHETNYKLRWGFRNFGFFIERVPVLTKGPSRVVSIKNIMNQESEFGAR
jgi:hypothetical protein